MQYHDFSWKGQLASTLGVVVERQAQYIRPAHRLERVEIPGRSGNLSLVEGAWPAYDVVLHAPECYLRPGFSVTSLAAFLTGSGLVVFGSMPERAYQARLVNQVPFAALEENGGYLSFSPIFECQPLAYQATPADEIVMTVPGGVLVNPGTAPAAPVVTIIGSGDISFTLGGRTVDIAEVVDGIILDWAMEDCMNLSRSVLLNNYVDGEPQLIAPGSNFVSWEGTVTEVRILPNWRYL